jgi:hypothetical protein
VVQAYVIAVSTTVLAVITLAMVRTITGNHAEEDDEASHSGSSEG